RGLLAMGAPDYDVIPGASGASSVTHVAARYRGPHSSCGAFRDVRFSALPGTRGEVADVAALWASAHGGALDAADARIDQLTGARATEAAFEQLCGDRRVIHLATHAFVTGDDCAETPGMRGVGGLVPDGGATPAPVPTRDDPMLFSGLVLAGA